MNITAEMIEKAYKYLKTYAYNEKYNLFIKKELQSSNFLNVETLNLHIILISTIHY